ncbi:polysaccharide lyase 6 family protein [Sandaracinus amylolyticus]|uniref:polysaccharide lyase 6 family protein n=1 Tax=Sandaracinus amylolyticus TaxID=927083 RepID=UPI001F31C164|nr:polysaccharide lyase 6 family protein [Sandaracinus amylolyticus]UJR78334.1 Hypothetical protein I5071_3610 [Sandaracinus amylolyticus]
MIERRWALSLVLLWSCQREVPATCERGCEDAALADAGSDPCTPAPCVAPATSVCDDDATAICVCPSEHELAADGVSCTRIETWVSGDDFGATSALGELHGLVRLSFDVTPQRAGATGIIGYAPSSTTIASVADLPVQLRLDPSGHFEALDGTEYGATAVVAWHAARNHHVEIEVDILGREYSIFVDEILLAEDFAMGPGTADDLASCVLHSERDGDFSIRRHVVGSPPTPEADGLPAPLRTFVVNAITGPGSLVQRIDEASPGDEIVVADGVYTLDEPIVVEGRHGTAENPIVIRAAHVLGVELRGGPTVGGFVIESSSHVVVRGFRLTHGVVPGSRYGIGLRLNGSTHCRVSRNRFRLEETGTSSHWLVIDGVESGHHRVDHNRFEQKHTMNNFVVVYGTDAEGEPAMSQQDLIDHNYFFDVPPTGLDDGTEAIRIGDSARGYIPARSTLEHNLFERCNGDPRSDGYEVVSVKSSDNVLRYNTLRDNDGSLVLRHGNRSRVEGNFFIGNRGGMRFYGDDHVVVNNYFSGTHGSESLESALYIGKGRNIDGEAVGTDANQPSHVIFAFNTFVGNERNLYINGDDSYPHPPRELVFADNIVTGSSGALFDFETDPIGFVYENNIVHPTGSASVGDIAEGYQSIDPGLALQRDGVYRLTPGSPAIDAASSAARYEVTEDVDGHARDALADVGADEHAAGDPLRRPLTRFDVGPGAR